MQRQRGRGVEGEPELPGLQTGLPPPRFFDERPPTMQDLADMRKWVEWRSTKARNPALRRWSLPIREVGGVIVENPTIYVAQNLPKLGNLEGKRILNWGSGPGRDALWALRRGADVTVYDRSEDALEFLEKWHHEWRLKGRLFCRVGLRETSIKSAVGGGDVRFRHPNTFEVFNDTFERQGEPFDAVISVDSFHHQERPGRVESFFELAQSRTAVGGIHIIKAYNSKDEVLKMEKLEDRYAPRCSELVNHYVGGPHIIGRWEVEFMPDRQEPWSFDPSKTRHFDVVIAKRIG